MIVDLPKLDQVHKMGTSQLVRILRHCPLCIEFAQTAEELRERLTKRQMLDIIAKLIVQTNNKPNMDEVMERNSRSEAASFQSSFPDAAQDNSSSCKEVLSPFKLSDASISIKLKSHSENKVLEKFPR